MKLSIGLVFYLVLELFCHINLFAQDQNPIKNCQIPETNEHNEIRFGILLPPSYSKEKEYPIIYYLHGLNGFYSGWQEQNIAEFFKTHTSNGDIPECILVFPDGKEGFWCNHFDKDPLLEKEIFEFLIPYINQNYTVDATKNIIMGWSAGGVGAMYFFARHPELFKAVISLDGAIITWEEFVSFQGEKPQIINNSEYYYEFASPNEWIVRNKNIIKGKSETSIFLIASLFKESHQSFLSVLKNQEIPFKYKELNCNHEFECVFSQTSNDLLFFLSKTLE